MPALITHCLFGEEALKQLPEGIIGTEEERQAFLLGNQGPDPLFARFFTLPDRSITCHRLGHEMHAKHARAAMTSLRDGVNHVRREDQGVGRAFALGMLGHYLLDSRAHAFIFGQEYALCDAGAGLGNAKSEVHGVIESDIDVWMLWHLRHETVLDAPAYRCLARTRRITRVAGSLLSQTALEAYDTLLHPDEYAGACKDYSAIYHVIDPYGAPLLDLASAIERVGRAHSQARAMSHHVTSDPDGASLNLGHEAWTDPYTHVTHTESFCDLFEGALGEWDGLARAFVMGDRDELAERMGSRNYNGEPVED